MKGKLGSLFLAIIGTSGYDICHNIAGGKISPFLGAAVIGATEIFLTIITFSILFLLGKAPGSFSFSRGGVIACIGIGTFAWCIDIGLLDVYKLKEVFHLSRIAPLVIVTAAALTFMYGIFVNGESLDRDKIVGFLFGLGSLYFLIPK